MNKIWIGTNWKMHKSLQEGMAYCRELIRLLDEVKPAFEVFVIPPHTSLLPLRELTRESRLLLGAQNMHWLDEGAYTGEISPKMLNEIGIDLIELGHSERRQYYNENDIAINKKVHAAIRHGIKPLICIGETAEQKEYGISLETIAAQVKVCLYGIDSDQAGQLMLAYEPVWAIGEQGIPADPAYIANVHRHIRQILREQFGSAGDAVPILYGGSVHVDNSLQYLAQQHVDGLFIGRSAWNMFSFEEIIRKVHAFQAG
ncbi:triose-phosphate isomerase [Brevibacillus massiliensis]|jgi:triosephosphate isomerase|uniref:triose-phosphate isomerase n=1 Tax=Brevibacillus massiliensis TaxID=1118054 RepID=UPI00036ADE37|nr:triose-phosphate isomerase [Brevibacillus massiliensis]